MRRASPRNHLEDALLTNFKNKIKLSNLLFRGESTCDKIATIEKKGKDMTMLFHKKKLNGQQTKEKRKEIELLNHIRKSNKCQFRLQCGTVLRSLTINT